MRVRVRTTRTFARTFARTPHAEVEVPCTNNASPHLADLETEGYTVD